MITLVTILGIVAIVLMSSLDCERIKSVQHRGLSITVFFLSFILGAIVLRTIPDRFGLVDNNRCESQIKYVEDKLKAQAELPANILVLDGASYSQYGLDGEQLAHYLSGKGYPTHVLQMTIAGGDQFERYYMHRSLMARLGGEWKKKLESRNCVLMLEDCHLYDQNPLGTIKTFGLHERCITYLNVPRCFFALKSIVEMTLNGTVPLYSKLSGKFLYDVISCALINSLNVGRVDRLVDSQDLRPLPPFAPWDTITKSYKYPGIRTVLDATKKTPPVLIRPWLEKYRQEYLFPIYRGVADSVVYYMPPVAYSIPLIHALNVKKKYAAARHILPDQAIYKTLDRREYWHDEGHMTTAGSRIYTAWLGDQLIAQGILRK